MKTSLECLPCFVRQTVDAVRMVPSETKVRETILREILRAIAGMDLDESPPVMGQHIHRVIRRATGCDDPYRELKTAYNQYALSLYPELKQTVETAQDPLLAAIRLAIAGNIIDFGASLHVDRSVIEETISSALKGPLVGDAQDVFAAAGSGKSILYLGDNTGEIVFDRLLIEQLPRENIVFAVRGSPVINDATLEDAEAVGLTRIVRVISNGSDAPGTVLRECTPEFQSLFRDVDMVIAKGQGNFETLSQVDRDIVFLLKAKCPVVADHIGCRVGDSIAGRVDTIGTSTTGNHGKERMG